MFHGERKTSGMLIVIEQRTSENKGVFEMRCNNWCNGCEKMWNLLGNRQKAPVALRLAVPQIEGLRAWGRGDPGGRCATGGELKCIAR